MSDSAALPRERLRLERPAADLVRVTLDDPARANALSPRLIEELTAVYRHDWLGEGVRAVLLAGAGKNFSAGADLENLARLAAAGEEENLKDSRRLRDLFAAVLEQPALTLALVHGSCVAGGCGLATAHDFVVATHDARFLYSEVKIGFVAALVATFLPLRVDGRDVRELLLHPRFVDAEGAVAVGLANRALAPGADLLSEGEALAGEILASASSQSIAATKALLLANLGRPLGESLAQAAQINAISRSTADCRRGVEAFLRDKKAPVWR